MPWEGEGAPLGIKLYAESGGRSSLKDLWKGETPFQTIPLTPYRSFPFARGAASY
jgi:hypothetical protein